MITIKSKDEIALMAESGHLLSQVMGILHSTVDIGITTSELDRLAESEIKKRKGIASFKNYNGFPASICASVNEQVVHGFPSKRKLMDGDIIGIDLGMIFKGWHSDMARTFGVGNISPENQRLIEVTEQSFWNGIAMAIPGNRIGDIGHEVQRTAEAAGFSVVRALVGHGIGRSLHEAPEVPNFGKAGHGPRLTEGMTLAVEPMINAGTKEVYTLDDDWTVVTKDGKFSAHYENTIAVTDNGPKLLTTYGIKS